MEYQYQNTGRYFARVSEDIKELAERELLLLGAYDIKPVYRGIYFKADKSVLYKIVFRTRFINRILAPLLSFDCHSDRYLYKTAKKIKWDDFISFYQTFSVNSIVVNSNIKHSKFAALRLKDAIVDYFRERFRERPSVERRNPDIFFDLYIENNKAVISVDVAGGSLHKRGYRINSVQAPMSEIVASAIIEFSEWDGQAPLYDPCCGSGTLLAEAYIKATNTPASILKKNFGFQKLPDFDKNLWEKVRKEEMEKIKDIPEGLISGSDISEDAIKITKKNLTLLDKKGKIKVYKKDIFSIERINNSIIVSNPPYGIRMKQNKNLDVFYKNLGDFLKQKCKNSIAFIYFGDRKYIKNIGLKPGFKKVLSNGGLDGRLVKYEIY